MTTTEMINVAYLPIAYHFLGMCGDNTGNILFQEQDILLPFCTLGLLNLFYSEKIVHSDQ